MNQEFDILIHAVKQAGKRAMQMSSEGFETHRKADHSPVTSADLAVNAILHEALTKAFPDDGWMSEESPDSSERLNKSRVWIIDPIDGTSYFIKGVPQFSISVALVEHNQPIIS